MVSRDFASLRLIGSLREGLTPVCASSRLQWRDRAGIKPASSSKTIYPYEARPDVSNGMPCPP